MKTELKVKIVRLIADAIDDGLTAEEKEELFLEGRRGLRIQLDDDFTPLVQFLKRKRRSAAA